MVFRRYQRRTGSKRGYEYRATDIVALRAGWAYPEGCVDEFLAMICRQAMKRRPPGGTGPEVITLTVVRDVLGDGAVDALPAAVRAAIARERRRVADKSDGDAKPTSSWIEWLEQLPWTRRSTAPIDLARVRAALDAGHAGLGHAKARILEYLAVRRRNPLGTGAVICFLGSPSPVS